MGEGNGSIVKECTGAGGGDCGGASKTNDTVVEEGVAEESYVAEGE